MEDSKSLIRVLSVEGGGMRGLYSVQYLKYLEKTALDKFSSSDFIKQFNMLVGTSTGAIIACGLASGMSLCEIGGFYKNYGSKIFPKKMPTKKLDFLCFHDREAINKKGRKAIEDALKKAFEDKTLKGVYDDSKIALVLPSVNMTTHKAYIFKTPHNEDTNHRDDDITLVEACLACTAAPIYRSLAKVGDNLFVDGGLYASNPVLVALAEALRFANESVKKIEIYSLGLSLIPGYVIDSKRKDWGFCKWKFGAKVVEVSLAAQSDIFENLAKEFKEHFKRDVSIVRFPSADISADHYKVLSLDDTSEKSLTLMNNLAKNANDETNKLISDKESKDGQIIKSLLNKK